MPAPLESDASVEAGLRTLSERSPVMAELIARHGPYTPRRAERPDVFGALARAIVYQQLAGRAAAAIHGRFVALCGSTVTPKVVQSLDPDDIRAVGLSRAKRDAIVDLAAHAADGLLSLVTLDSLDDEALTRRLCRVRGIGPWTAQMFLIFELGRLDVWPTGDLAVRKGFGQAFGHDAAPTARELKPMGEPFKPYRSMVAWYCWRVLDTVAPSSP